MTDIDLLGPGAAGAPRALDTTTQVTDPDPSDTFFGDCVNNTAGTGTQLNSQFLNRLLQLFRRIIRGSGVPLVNTDDDLLGQALQAGQLTYAAAGGTANALTVTLNPVPALLTVGMTIRVLIGTTNTGAATLNGAAIVGPGGAALSGGELGAAGIKAMTWNGTAWQLEAVSLGRRINIQVIGATGTYNATPGTNSVIIDAVGGGGASGSVAGNNSSNNSVAGGGQAGARVKAWFTSGFSGGVAVTIGAGGVAGAAGNNAGGTGGATIFGSLISCPGGAGGAGGPSVDIATQISTYALGGNNTTEPTLTGAEQILMKSPGVSGGNGEVTSGGLIAGGLGGAWPELGITPAPPSISGPGVANAGVAATSPGAGASGPSSNTSSTSEAGQDGAAGQLIIEEYS